MGFYDISSLVQPVQQHIHDSALSDGGYPCLGSSPGISFFDRVWALAAQGAVFAARRFTRPFSLPFKGLICGICLLVASSGVFGPISHRLTRRNQPRGNTTLLTLSHRLFTPATACLGGVVTLLQGAGVPQTPSRWCSFSLSLEILPGNQHTSPAQFVNVNTVLWEMASIPDLSVTRLRSTACTHIQAGLKNANIRPTYIHRPAGLQFHVGSVM
ncbi:hypothetical protein BT67DRAFT_439707 [Trichocladium antarcticum]|uniref:Uncharacterized protein n=1 Tax=Trichocladium antarcticum TaxID=1450529 RepID=A0AAN6UPT2_9PEZI|nr:hypothetical protein BT67DRAFT_439707 [Trichocladium antarcticum]